MRTTERDGHPPVVADLDALCAPEVDPVFASRTAGRVGLLEESLRGSQNLFVLVGGAVSQRILEGAGPPGRLGLVRLEHSYRINSCRRGLTCLLPPEPLNQQRLQPVVGVLDRT